MMQHSNNPLVSICVPAYNHSAYIEECICSFIEQTYANIELLVLDDGSPDDTWEKICALRNKCEQRFVRVVMSTKQNEGTCETLNKLFSQAQGAYVLLCASDDRLLPQAVELLVHAMETRPELGLVLGGNRIIDSEGKFCYWDKARNNVYTEKEAVYKTFTDYLARRTEPSSSPEYGTYARLLRGNHIANGYLIRRSVLEIIEKFTPEAPLEDLWMMMQISKVSKIATIPEDTFCYRWHAANTVKQQSKMRSITNQTYLYEERRLFETKQFQWLDVYRRVRYYEPLLRDVYREMSKKMEEWGNVMTGRMGEHDNQMSRKMEEWGNVMTGRMGEHDNQMSRKMEEWGNVMTGRMSEHAHQMVGKIGEFSVEMLRKFSALNKEMTRKIHEQDDIVRDLILYSQHKRRYYYCRIMSHLTFGKKKHKYREQVRALREKLRRIREFCRS